ncbi:hypothetical protein EJ08DRAFT_692541 [Tothia fuscella]|uniref:Nephrocystin 3-like N-terminal domain-containing protein n=1 Tax=Tothia fuscella TaxID=1048955 RepID=A0A9P4U215_9PEZI|nr:hypothetical protein EJ08DRAFT_692541 [Tothia fuscella]
MSSLWFPSILERKDTIKENYSDTFAWVWKDPKPTQKPWADFRAFLQEAGGLCWITGKAGSGKSTLMKYINKSQELSQELDIWRHGKALIHFSFYFWYNGTPEQKSEKGVLLSLLHQILSTSNELIHVAFKERVRAMAVNTSPPSSFHLNTPELKRVSLAILQQLSETRFFISVDGLDEYSRDGGSFTEVAQFFLSFLQLGNVKLVLSSRPEREFETEFQRLPRLRLHDLTLSDIQKYTREKLSHHSRLRQLQLVDPDRCERLLADLVEASAGVFLWVCVVVTSLLIGLNNGQFLDDLEVELTRLPTELNELYEKTLERVPQKYQAKAALMMEIVRVGTENGCVLSAMVLSWALETKRNVLQNTQAFSNDEIVRRYDTLLAQTQSHTLGLIEIRENNGIGQGDYNKNRAQLSLVESPEADIADWTNIPESLHGIVFCALHWARPAGHEGNIFIEELDKTMIHVLCNTRQGLESLVRAKLDPRNRFKLEPQQKAWLLFHALNPGNISAKLPGSLPVYPGVVEALLKIDADPNTTVFVFSQAFDWPQAQYNMTPWSVLLSELARYRSLSLSTLEAIKSLIDHGADPNVVVNFDGGGMNSVFHQQSVLRFFKLALHGMNNHPVNKPRTSHIEAITQIIGELEARSAVEQEWQDGVLIIDTSKPAVLSAIQ